MCLIVLSCQLSGSFRFQARINMRRSWEPLSQAHLTHPFVRLAVKAREDRLHASQYHRELYYRPSADNTVCFHQFLCPSVLTVSSHSQNTPDNLQTSPYLLFINFNFPRTNEISQISFWIHLHSHTLKFLSCRNCKFLKCTAKSFIFLAFTPLKNTM